MSSYLKFYISTSLNNFIVADIYPKAETVLQNIQLQRRRNISVPGQGHWSLQRQFWRMVWNTPQCCECRPPLLSLPCGHCALVHFGNWAGHLQCTVGIREDEQPGGGPHPRHGGARPLQGPGLRWATCQYSTVQYSTVQYSTARPLQGPGLFISLSRCSLFLHLVLSHFHVPQSRNARYGQIGQCGDGIWFLV